MYIPHANDSAFYENERRRFEQELWALAKINHEETREVRICESSGTDEAGNSASSFDSDQTAELVADGEVLGMESSEKAE